MRIPKIKGIDYLKNSFEEPSLYLIRYNSITILQTQKNSPISAETKTKFDRSTKILRQNPTVVRKYTR